MKEFRMEKMCIFISAIIGTFFSLFGLLAIPLALLLPCILIDYITGIMASKVKDIKVTSKKSFEGIAKKVSMLVLIFVGFGIDVMAKYATVNFGFEFEFPLICSATVASLLVMNELISIEENCEVMGTRIPFLRPLLKLVKKKIENVSKIGDNDDKNNK